MRAKLPSVTALVVSMSRALPRDVGRPAVDPLAARMLPRPLGWLLGRAAELTEHDRTLVRLLPTASIGLVDHVSLRTLAIDDACERAVGEGARQLVILGAGFDTRAYRLPCLHDVHAFEVDHPATFAAKEKRSAGLRPCARQLTRVAIDFERDDLGRALEAAGHERAVPTVWIWEGVTMYLTEAALDSTLHTLAARSAQRSTLVMSYGPPDFAPPVFLAAVRALGEPVRCLLPPAAAAAKLDAHGFVARSDEGPADWLSRYGGGGWIVARERIVVGVKG